MLHMLARNTKVSGYKCWHEKVKSSHLLLLCIIEFINKTQRTTHQFKTILRNDNCKLVFGLLRKYKHETYKLPRLYLIKILSAHILQTGKGLVNYQGKEQQS